MKYLLFIGLIVIVSLVIYSCKTVVKNKTDGSVAAPSNEKNITTNIVMGLSKSSCKGTCEIYDITIDKNRNVLYNGIKNTSLLGKLRAKVKQTQFDNLKKLFESTNFAEHKSDYTTRIRDLQRFNLSFQGHLVVFQKKDGPKDLFPIIKAFDDLIKELDWIEPLEKAKVINNKQRKNTNQ